MGDPSKKGRQLASPIQGLKEAEEVGQLPSPQQTVSRVQQAIQLIPGQVRELQLELLPVTEGDLRLL